MESEFEFSSRSMLVDVQIEFSLGKPTLLDAVQAPT